MSLDDETDTVFEFLLGTGAVELSGMSPWGEPVYRVTAKCAEIFPEFYKVHREELNNTAYSLWARGVIDISFEDEDERIIFNETHYERLKECVDDLNRSEVEFLVTLGAPLNVQTTDETEQS